MSINYKNTLNLPQTDFPMKANLNQKEPEVLKFWEEKSIYRKLQEKNRSGKRYILHDGPPYANGNIHIGHALNKILKDIIVKYKSMMGYYSPFVPGWDCHGLPIELQVDKNIGKKPEATKKKVGVLQKRQLCREYSDKFVNIQREEFKRLGVFGDWDKPYITMSYDYEASIVREFFRFVKNGSVYKGKKPVHWCPSCVTALAEAEVEYAEKESPSIFVRFQILKEDAAKLLRINKKKTYILIWTTTPWTLPANLALAVNPDVTYVAVEGEEEIHIIAEDNFEKLKSMSIIKGDVVLKFLGSKLEGIKARHPFIDRVSSVIPGDFVATGEGSGVVHIAPGHGEDDYEAGLKYNLDIYAPVDDWGKFTNAVADFAGQFVFKANEGIIEVLKAKNALSGGVEKIIHSYPHCWRCKKPVIFRATAQWFISMKSHDLRKRCLEEIGKVEWIPSWGKERIYAMVSSRPDWCISRQRAWGVPITLITCEDCGIFIKDDDLFNKIIELTIRHGADFWFKMNISDITEKQYKCKCGCTSFKKEMDILDVWFDSGVSHAAVLERDERLSWPASMYLEGSDQHRGWFQSSLLTSVGTREALPYGSVVTHGFAVDGRGKKMSKSLGNVISPQKIINTNGAEILRLWVSAEDYSNDVKLSSEIISRLTEAYRKIRNTERFLLSNLYDYDGKDYSDCLLEIDKWAMSRLQSLIKKVSAAYENFNFHEVFHSLYNFCVVDMSSFYLDILKDRLYTFKADSPERRAAQWVLHQILIDTTKLMAPILSFTAEEIWQFVQKLELKTQNPKPKTQNSVFLSSFPSIKKQFLDNELEKRWESLLTIRSEANKALEIKRKEKIIGTSLDAKLVLYLQNEEFNLIQAYKDFLPTLFIVSEVEVHLFTTRVVDACESAEIKDLYIKVERASGGKCERCWNWSTEVGVLEDHPQICERCHNVLV